MKDIFTEKGIFHVSIGRGFISSFEASVLKPGDVVRTDQIAGTEAPAYFNGKFICAGAIVIIDEVFGLRVSEMEPSAEQPAQLSNTDDIVEILPMEVRLASIPLSITELKGISWSSFINLDKKYTSDEDVELWIAGIPFARGRTSVYGEYMAIRITTVFDHNFSESNIRASGYIVDDNKAQVKDYNYKMPDAFTWASLQNLKTVQEMFLKNLRIRHPELSGMQVTASDQCTFGEAVKWLERDIGKEQYSLLYIGQNSWNSNSEDLQNSFSYRFQKTTKHVLQPHKCANPFSDSAVEFLHSLFDTSSRGIYKEQPVFVAVKNSDSAATIIRDQSELQYFTACLRSGWKKYVDFNFSETKVYPGPDGPEDWLEHEMVAIVVMADEKGNFIEFIYPYFTLEPILKIIG
jgi:flagellar motor switch/type III secretory pathway protein FliN